MKRWITILSVVCVLQLALAGALSMNGDEFGAFESGEKLLALAGKGWDTIRLEDGEGKSLVLKKKGETWVMPSLADFPADGDGVSGLTEKLEGLERGWPVATTSGAASRFKVDEGEFERKLTFLEGDKTVAALFVGTSPGLRKVHV